MPLEDEDGNSAAASIAWVHMRNPRAARALDRLDYRDGTGALTASGHSTLASRGLSFTGELFGRTAAPVA